MTRDLDIIDESGWLQARLPLSLSLCGGEAHAALRGSAIHATIG